MLKYLFILVLVVGCSKNSSTREVVNEVSSGLNEAQNYHDYLEEVVEPAAQKTIQNYKRSPDEVCNEFANTSLEELTHLNDVLEEVKYEIPCAADALARVQSYYDNYSNMAMSARSSKITTMFSAKKTVSSSELILDKAYSLPGEKQLPSKVINLTFDDGPHSENTAKVLNTLKTYGVKANFFVLGNNAKKYPVLIEQTAADGHSIGGHSMSHKSLDKLSFDSATKEIMGVFDVVEKLLGGVDPFFRFPYGARTSALRNYLSKNNISDFFWNVDTLDWKYKNPTFLLDYALKQTTKTGRGIVLFHDIQPQTAAMLPAYLDALGNLGYSTVVYEPQQ